MDSCARVCVASRSIMLSFFFVVVARGVGWARLFFIWPWTSADSRFAWKVNSSPAACSVLPFFLRRRIALACNYPEGVVLLVFTFPKQAFVLLRVQNDDNGRTAGLPVARKSRNHVLDALWNRRNLLSGGAGQIFTFQQKKKGNIIAKPPRNAQPLSRRYSPVVFLIYFCRLSRCYFCAQLVFS